jgi:mono/diheme cytochrome c family protein
MSTRILVATYDCEEGILSGAEAARDNGITIVDAYTPYAVHGLDEAMGLKPSRLTWVCFGLGALAVVFMTWFQWWTSAVSWPINIGGKPWNSLPAFVPVIFEAMVLCAGLGTVAVLFFVCRLLPGKQARLIIDGITDDRFALVIEHENAALDLDEMQQLFQPSHPIVLDERILDETSNTERDEPFLKVRGGRKRWLSPVNLVLLGVLVVLVGANLLMVLNPETPNWELFPEMMHSPADQALSASNVLPGQITFQPPVPGTIARGLMPLHYEKNEASELAAGRELDNPFQTDEEGRFEPGVRERGQYVFTTYCACCHGATGGGDGPVTTRGFPPPPAFAIGKSLKMNDGQLFHMITYGKANMPPHAALVARDDRWKAIVYVRELQEKAKTKAAEDAAKATATVETVSAAGTRENVVAPQRTSD